jgi:hypothetical protein
VLEVKLGGITLVAVHTIVDNDVLWFKSLYMTKTNHIENLY